MTSEEALQIVSRQAPCVHDSADTSLGDGRTWAKCEDCGVTFPQDGWTRSRAAAKQFDDAIECLRAGHGKGAAAMTDHTPPLGPLPEQFEKAMTDFGIACAYGQHSARLESGRALMDAATAHALQERAAVQQWRPIETAPRDGTEVLYWSHECGFIAGNAPPNCVQGRWELYRGEWTGGAQMRAIAATHWMPLPPPPQRAEPGKDAA